MGLQKRIERIEGSIVRLVDKIERLKKTETETAYAYLYKLDKIQEMEYEIECFKHWLAENREMENIER